MKVLLLGMENEFVDKSTSGIVKYMHALFTEMNKMKDVEVSKTEYSKVSSIFPWANHLAFYFESRFSDFSGYDMLHNPNSLRLFAKPRGKKLVTTVHNVMFMSEKIRMPGSGLKNGLALANSLLVKYASEQGFELSLNSDWLIADTEHGKREMLEFAHGYDRNRISVVRLGIDDKFMVGKPQPHREKDKKGFKIGFLGSFNYYQNIPSMIAAVKMIEDPKVSLEMWGDRSIETELLEKEMSSDRRIRLMSPVQQDRKVQIYDSFDVFVHPGVYEGLPIFEALSRGVPVIVFKKIRIDPELRIHCMQAKDAAHMAQLIQGIKENGYSETKRKKAMEFARQFTWRRTAKQTIKVYEKVLQD